MTDNGELKQKVKKVKEQKELDYSRMPDHIFEKHLKEFQDTMQDIEQSLGWVGRSIARLEKHYAREDEIKPLPKVRFDKERLNKFSLKP